MTKTYFVIYNSDDGMCFDQVDSGGLDELLQYFQNRGKFEFMTKMPSSREDFHYGCTKVLIIEGNIIVPKPVKVVEKYEF